MKLVIFAGGGGTRFWPISRENLPKQFVPIQGKNSTLQLSFKRIQPIYGWKNVYLSTNEKYVKQVKKQLPKFINENIFTEPARRDVGPAVGLSLVRLRKAGVTEPVFIGWADHLIKDVPQFQKLLQEAGQSISKNEYKAILWTDKPNFANSNLGWTHFKKSNNPIKDFLGHVYRPSQKDADKYFKSGDRFFYTGYIISTAEYLLKIYQKHAPNLYADLLKIEEALGTKEEANVINTIYPNIEKKNFDEVVLYNLPKKDVGVVASNMGWEDPGTLFALKKSLEPTTKSFVKGKGLFQNSTDGLIYNTEKTKMVIGANLEDVVIVNTKDVVYVTNKEGVIKVKELIEELKKEKEYEKYL